MPAVEAQNTPPAQDNLLHLFHTRSLAALPPDSDGIGGINVRILLIH
jgi:hypothetical protein